MHPGRSHHFESMERLPLFNINDLDLLAIITATIQIGQPKIDQTSVAKTLTNPFSGLV